MNNRKNTWLWKITGENLPGDSYLFGTIHSKDLRAFTYLEEALNYLSECDAVATEFNLDEMENRSSADSLNMPPDFSLTKELGPRLIKRLEKLFLEYIGLPFRAFDNMHPFVITSLLTEAVLNNDMPMSLDKTIWVAAKENNKFLDGLETYDMQMKLIGEMDLNLQIKMVKQMIRNFKAFRRNQNKLIKLYEKADLGTVNKVSRKQGGAFRKVLLYRRNEYMADRIFELSHKEKFFFAVGGAHLPGKRGLIRLLKKMGCKVSPVQLSTAH